MQEILNHTLIRILGKSERSREWRMFRKEVHELPHVRGHGPGRAVQYRFVDNE
jgi:hypothetical protein